MKTLSAESVASVLGEQGYVLEPFRVTSMTLGVLSAPVSSTLRVYLNIVQHKKDRSFGCGVGFGSVALQKVADDCVLALARRHGIALTDGILSPCPALLFSLECFVGQEVAENLTRGEVHAEKLAAAVHKHVVLGEYSWLTSFSDLLKVLVNFNGSFPWYLGGVPRRVTQAASIMSSEGVQPEVIEHALLPASEYLSTDIDFGRYPANFVSDAANYFAQSGGLMALH